MFRKTKLIIVKWSTSCFCWLIHNVCIACRTNRFVDWRSVLGTLQAWYHYVSTLGSEPVTEKHIYHISPSVGSDWKDVLRSLSMKEKAIENLSADHKYDKITEQCIQGLLKWKELEAESATIKILAGALLHARCFDALQTLQNSTR